MAASEPATAASDLTPAEAAMAIRELSPGGWIRLRNVAQAYARLCKVDAEDLLQRTFLQTLDGKRRCPRNIEIIKFLAEAMRSIASDWAKARKRRPDLRAIPLQGEPDDNPIDPPADQPNQEQQLINDEEEEEAARRKQCVLDLFADDVEAQVIVEGMMEGMEGEALRETTGLDKTAFASKRRKIRRRLDKAFPTGSKL